MGVSRTPLKVALARLEMEGLVEIRPRSGTYVTDPSPKDLAEAFEVRMALELFCLSTITQDLTDDDLRELRTIVDQLDELAASLDRDEIYPQYLELDHRLHNTLVSLAGNEKLRKIHQREDLHSQMARIRYRRSERELSLAQREHLELLTALEARDTEAACRVMRAHLTRAKSSLLAEMNAEVVGAGLRR